jgi:uncharacterized protein (DUF983 family)
VSAVKQPSLGQMLWRGARKKCPVCGGGHLYTRWLRMAERCPRCGFKFEREEGFFLGAFVVNVAVTEFAMLVAIVLGVALTLPDPPVLLLSVLGVVSAVIVPVLSYPFSKTVWSALDLAMHPLEAGEANPA